MAVGRVQALIMIMDAPTAGAGETVTARSRCRANHIAGWHTRAEMEVGRPAVDGKIASGLITIRLRSVGRAVASRVAVPVRFSR